MNNSLKVLDKPKSPQMLDTKVDIPLNKETKPSNVWTAEQYKD